MRAGATVGQPVLVLALVLTLVLAGAGAGCNGCPDSKPYTPYTLDSSPVGTAPAPPTPPSSGPGGDVGAPDAAAPSFAVVPGIAPPEDGKRWPLDAGAIAEAPAGRTFDTGLVLDADGDGVRDLVAWARAPDGLRGELRLTPGARPGDARTLAALPGDLAARGCTPQATLAQIGPATLAFDFAPKCGARRRGKAVRWIAIVRIGRSAPELVFELRVRDPPAHEALAASLDASDRDGDGRDDLSITLALSGALEPFPAAAATELRAPLVFFDRPAGLSRDPSQPGDTLRALADGLLTDARRKDAAPGVAPAALALRRLHALLCADAGPSAVATRAGPISCGQPRLDESIKYADAVAASTRGDTLAAIAAIDSPLPVDRAPSRSKDAEKLLAKLAPIASASVTHRVTTTPATRAGTSPLAFDGSGDLLVRAADGVVRVDRATFDEASDDAVTWPAASAAAIAGVEHRCESSTLIALVRAAPDAAGATEVPLPILADRAPCTTTTRIPFALLGASEGGIDLAVGATLVSITTSGASPSAHRATLPLAAPALPGAARSPDGATLAIPLPGALLVTSTAGARRWTGAEIEQATLCVPQNGGTRVACIAGGGSAAVIYDAR